MKLFNLDPIGVGTPECESLPSYIHRLSRLHGVSIGQLLERVERLSRRQDAPYRKNPCLASFVRPNGTTHALVEDLELVTNQGSLAVLTLLPLRACISRDVSCYSKDLRWCPSCLADKASLGGDPYYKLIWQFSDLNICPLHGDEIVRVCPQCGKHQNSFKARARAEICQGCRKFLPGDQAVYEKSLPSTWKNDAVDLCELVERLPAYLEEPLDENGPAQFLDSVFDYYWFAGKELELYKKVDHHEMLSIIDGSTPVTLRTIRKFAYQLNVSIDRVLSGSNVPFEPPLDLVDTYRPNQVRRKTRAKKDHPKILRQIKAVIDQNGPDLSLRQLARETGVSVGYIENRLPHVKNKVVKARADFLVKEESRKWQESLAAAHEYFTRNAELFVMSRKKALKVLIAETRLPKHVLRKAIRIAFEQQSEEV